MVQAELIHYLEKMQAALTCRQISKAIDVNFTIVARALKSMSKYHEIGFYELSREEAAEYLDYQINRRIMVYYPIGFIFHPPEISEVEHNLEN